MNEMFLLKLGEIVLKGGNRFQFENRLKTNVARRMRPISTPFLIRPWPTSATI